MKLALSLFYAAVLVLTAVVASGYGYLRGMDTALSRVNLECAKQPFRQVGS